MANESSLILTDGQQSFSGGVDSNKVTTMAHELVPNGLKRDQLAWLINATIRDGGITCRTGWLQRGMVSDGSALFQGWFYYEPLQGFPYLVVLIGGVLYRIDLQTYVITDLTGGNPALLMPATQPHAYFRQAEEFLIIQAGDYVTLPLFWDNAILRRSLGITNTAVAPGTPGVNEIPAAGPMAYYKQRLWYSQFRSTSAGDIVGGTSGTIAHQFRDSVLNVTENPLCVGGDGFTVPTYAGNVRALMPSATLDQTLGQKNLYIFTRKQIYALTVPENRKDWIAADSTNMPIQSVVHFDDGAVNDRSIVGSNSDYFFQTLQPSVQSLMSSLRYFGQWGNRPISSNEDRILQFTDRALMSLSCGMKFQNRMWQSALPKQTAAGVAHQAMIPLDFDPISSFQVDAPPAWHGHYEGLDFLGVLSGDFGGLERAFGLTVSRLDSAVELWEFSPTERFDRTLTDDRRITWITETPAYHFSIPQKLKQLKGGEIWVDRAYGLVTVQVWYRVDADPCWVKWHTHEFCVARSTCENVVDPICYPETGYGEGYRWPIVLPKPPAPCDSMHVRPSDTGYQFQLKIAISGWCRIRSIFVYGVELPRSIYQGLTTQNTPPQSQAIGV